MSVRVRPPDASHGTAQRRGSCEGSSLPLNLISSETKETPWHYEARFPFCSALL